MLLSKCNLKKLKANHSSAQNPAKFSNFEFSFRVGFGAKTNTARKQNVISTASIWYISPSHDCLSRFGFLLTHRAYLGNCHG